uniref:Alpha/beta hydrolase n=1 Tax=Paraburkholderia sprentiae WSM5005 TaxID=754502 RepID=A0A1I9YFV8_9BURK
MACGFEGHDRDRQGCGAPRSAREARPLPVEFAGLGHAPQMQDPNAFHKALLDGLAAVPANR